MDAEETFWSPGVDNSSQTCCRFGPRMATRTMKLSVWAQQHGLSYRTAWRMWRAGTLPAECEQLATGTVLVRVQSPEPHGVALYARVSSHDQRADLDRQLARLVEFAAREKLVVVDSAKEIGSGLNGNRRALTGLLRNADVGAIVVEHRDRLARFGFEYIEAALASSNRKLIVVDQDEVKDDIVRDLHEIIVSLCSRLYGKRSAERRAKKAVEAFA